MHADVKNLQVIVGKGRAFITSEVLVRYDCITQSRWDFHSWEAYLAEKAKGDKKSGKRSKDAMVLYGIDYGNAAKYIVRDAKIRKDALVKLAHRWHSLLVQIIQWACSAADESSREELVPADMLAVCSHEAFHYAGYGAVSQDVIRYALSNSASSSSSSSALPG